MEAERGGFAARVVILPLEGNTFLFTTGEKIGLNLCVLGPKEPLYVCVQSGRRSKHILHWCISYSNVWYELCVGQILRTIQRPKYAD